jgi:hypothetical protein
MDVLGEDAVGVEDSGGFGAEWGGGVEERARGAEFAIDESEAFFFGPCFVVLAIESCGLEDLADGFFVEFAVLADVEGGEVESEGVDEVDDRVDVGFCEFLGADGDEAVAEGFEVAEEFLWVAVAVWGIG